MHYSSISVAFSRKFFFSETKKEIGFSNRKSTLLKMLQFSRLPLALLTANHKLTKTIASSTVNLGQTQLSTS